MARVYDPCKLKYKIGDVVCIDRQQRWVKRMSPSKVDQQDKFGIVLDIVEKQHLVASLEEISFYLYSVLVGLNKIEVSEEDLRPPEAAELPSS